MVCRLVHRESLDRLLLLCAPRGFGHHRECRLQGCDGSDGQVLVLPLLDGGGQEIGVCFSRFRSTSQGVVAGKRHTSRGSLLNLMDGEELLPRGLVLQKGERACLQRKLPADI